MSKLKYELGLDEKRVFFGDLFSFIGKQTRCLLGGFPGAGLEVASRASLRASKKISSSEMWKKMRVIFEKGGIHEIFQIKGRDCSKNPEP